MQVESIAPMFNLDPGRPLWIVTKAGNIAVWLRGGKFTGPLVTPGSAYEVRGHVPPASPVPMSLPGADTRRDVSSTFSVYTSPTCSIAGPSHTKKKTWERQLDMEVELLDSKCYPFTENESTSTKSFWKSSCKILAANKSLYDKVSCQSTNVMRSSIDLTKGGIIKESDSSGSSQLEPATKCPCLSSSVTAKLDEIAKGV